MTALARLRQYASQRQALTPAFAPLWPVLDDAAEGWAEAVLELAWVNAGPGCLAAAATLTRRRLHRLEELAVCLHQAAELCRRTDATTTLAALETMQHAAAVDPVAWWRILVGLAGNAPESVLPACRSMARLLRPAGLAGLAEFVATGIRQAGGRAERRRAFFALEDKAALQTLARLSGAVGYAEVEPTLTRYATALWARPPLLRAAPLARRTSLSGDLIMLPALFAGVAPDAAPMLYRVSLAHAGAHLAFGGPRFPLGKLKPLQVALITLLEDARVEALAMQRFPGLRRLWHPYHQAEAGGVPSAAGLLARLARALFDPAWPDPDGLVAMARRLFAAADRSDPQSSRTIGNVLGHEIGQQRLGFNARTYVVEPPYRDDGWGLWEADPADPPDPDTADLMVEAARLNRTEDEDRGPAQPAPRAAAARPAHAADEPGPVLATVAEWDRHAQVARPDWTTIREGSPRLGDAGAITALLDADPQLRSRVARLVRGARVGRAARLRRQAEGEELDLDAALDAISEQRAGLTPDHRVHRGTGRRRRELALALLLDVSASTGARLPGGSVLDLQRQAVALLAEPLGPAGDAFTVLAFASNGREDVRLFTVKALGEPWSAEAQARLAGLSAGLSTRLGAALRHTGTLLRKLPVHRRLVLVLTDGAPFDIDTPDPADLAEDARHAVLTLKQAGIDVFGMILGQQDMAAAEAIFGRASCLAVPRLDALPARLSQMYARLTRA